MERTAFRRLAGMASTGLYLLPLLLKRPLAGERERSSGILGSGMEGGAPMLSCWKAARPDDTRIWVSIRLRSYGAEAMRGEATDLLPERVTAY